MTSESSFELLVQINFKTFKDKMLRTLNCCSSKPIDLGWTTMNTMAIETATQNFLIGQVVMMDIYTDDDFVLAFVILYPLIILFISVSFKDTRTRDFTGHPVLDFHFSVRMNRFWSMDPRIRVLFRPGFEITKNILSCFRAWPKYRSCTKKIVLKI